MIPIFEPDLTGKEQEYVNDALTTGWISSQGNEISKFEQQFSSRIGKRYGVATTNCTAALHLSLAVLGISVGDEVICPDLTFIAPANMVELSGAKVVLVDVEEESWNLDPELMRKAITEKTKAIIVVHAFGHAAKMDEIQEIADHFQIPIIEDNAESPGGTYKGQTLGSFGKLSCFSFFANKILTTGEGGMVMTDDEELFHHLKELRDHGMSRNRKYVHIALGFNYRMTNLQASIGLAQLERFDVILEKRQLQEQKYENYLSNSEKLSFHPKNSWEKSVHWLMTIHLQKEGIRDLMLAFLKAKGIDCRQMIYPVHYAQHFKAAYSDKKFTVSERISLNSLHLPSSTNLPDNSIELISEIVIEGLNQHG
jgi:perosamine synthetase